MPFCRYPRSYTEAMCLLFVIVTCVCNPARSDPSLGEVVPLKFAGQVALPLA